MHFRFRSIGSKRGYTRLRGLARAASLMLIPLYAATFTVAVLNHADCTHHFAPWLAQQVAAPSTADASAAADEEAGLCQDPATQDGHDHDAPCRCGDLSCHGAVAAGDVATPIWTALNDAPQALNASDDGRLPAPIAHAIPFANGPPTLG